MEYFQLLYATCTSQLSKQNDITAHGLSSELTVASISLMSPWLLLRPYQHTRLTFHRSIPAKGELKKGGMGRDTCRRQRKGRGGRGRVLWDESHCYHEGKKMAFSAFSVCSSHIKMTKTINSGQG